MATYNLNINGKMQTVEAESDTPILWVLRDTVGLVGTKYGCGIAQCGACTINLFGFFQNIQTHLHRILTCFLRYFIEETLFGRS